MFSDASGPLYEFLKDIRRLMNDCGNRTPLELFLTIRDSSASLRSAGNDNNWLLAHLNQLTESDFELLKNLERKPHIVHSPRSHDYFKHSPFPFEKLRVLGFNVCLGTDSLASNEDLSLFAEMRAFQKEFPSVSPEEIFKMVTVNPARALRYENALGRIQPGFRADLISIPCSGTGDVFEEVMAFEKPVDWDMAGV